MAVYRPLQLWRCRERKEFESTENSAPNLSYRILDVLCPEDAQVLYEEIGDANIYMRTVLHQLSPTDHATAIQSIGICRKFSLEGCSAMLLH